MSIRPITLYIVAAYNLAAAVGLPMEESLLWSATPEEVLLLGLLLALFTDLWRSAAPTPTSAERVAAMLVLLLVCIVEFTMVRFCTTVLFFIVTAAIAVETVLGGYLLMTLKGKNFWISSNH